MKKVTRWLHEVVNRTNCEIVFSVPDKAEKENEPPQVETKKIQDDTNTVNDSREHKSPPWASIVQTATSSLCLAHMNPHDEIPIRGSEINKIMTFIRERVEQQNGGAMYICGSPGTGKSIAVSRAVYNLNRPTESSQNLPPYHHHLKWNRRDLFGNSDCLNRYLYNVFEL